MKPQTFQQPLPPSAHRKNAPAMPRIPGVSDAPAPAGSQPKPLLAVALAALLCASGLALWLLQRRARDLNASPHAEAATPSAPIRNISSTRTTDADPDAIATLYELAKPWSSKTFQFVDPKTQQSIPAMVIHLPGSATNPSFWAFALANPLSRCQLQYVTDLSVLSKRYVYSAEHPMVVSDCDGVLYDPLKMATLPDGTWVRGDIVRGGGIRPPTSIQVEVRGRDLLAKRME
ncbi:MAG: hypothetical protein DMG30_20365 [Acidobacteria bacterium]|nr:MAG: hypothetical protein DMG30_20365 [Acidobacteriota bacterium]